MPKKFGVNAQDQLPPLERMVHNHLYLNEWIVTGINRAGMLDLPTKEQIQIVSAEPIGGDFRLSPSDYGPGGFCFNRQAYLLHYNLLYPSKYTGDDLSFRYYPMYLEDLGAYSDSWTGVKETHSPLLGYSGSFWDTTIMPPIPSTVEELKAFLYMWLRFPITEDYATISEFTQQRTGKYPSFSFRLTANENNPIVKGSIVYTYGETLGLNNVDYNNDTENNGYLVWDYTSKTIFPAPPTYTTGSGFGQTQTSADYVASAVEEDLTTCFGYFDHTCLCELPWRLVISEGYQPAWMVKVGSHGAIGSDEKILAFLFNPAQLYNIADIHTQLITGANPTGRIFVSTAEKLLTLADVAKQIQTRYKLMIEFEDIKELGQHFSQGITTDIDIDLGSTSMFTGTLKLSFTPNALPNVM